ncbi:hypothetical protein BJV82DRAFT_616024 [Fennellomyces sp. T-0311]|nr:hypothetical protein BJV82DRAFT_616024 [Fennellomyces sp. T-0311]
MLEAADLVVDILSLSLGQFSSWPEEAMSVLADRISADGVKGNNAYTYIVHTLY